MITLDEAARRVRMVYPALTADEARQVAELEREYPRWHVWPRVGYPATPGWYARRTLTSPPALIRAATLAQVSPAIESWIEEHAAAWRWAGQAADEKQG